MFDIYGVENLIATSSDHYPVPASLDNSSRQNQAPPVQQGFRFEAMWLRADDYKDTVEQAWSDVRTLSPIPASATVHCLINEEQGVWEEESVRAFFLGGVADDILQIPINRNGGNDFARWPFTKYRVYSVKSAYNMARTCSFLNERSKSGLGQCSSWPREEKLWKSLWCVKVPNKMKIVLWRVAHDCFPSGDQLRRRQIPTRTDCCFCGRTESVEHALLFCPHARAVWDVLKASFNIRLRRSFISPKQWLFDFLSSCSDQEATTITVSIWHIWEARNAARNEPMPPPPRRTAARAKAYIDLILQHLYKSVLASRRETWYTNRQWSPPPQGTVVAFSDAAVSVEQHKSGIGVVVLNHEGLCVAACSDLLRGALSPEVAEALALRRAVRLACDEGFDNVTFT
ncbi:uncharacterized protein [Aegilops tauschii subsp. strangulata]|uniref:uncharacterized protein n=1 Tax=Aegilops tauschii subsp. strangulata TaxID=200361 RepID=UPI003CC8B416